MEPLIIRGARQVGKSELIQKFGERFFSRIHVFNFEKTKELKQVFAGSFEIEAMVSQLEIHAHSEINLEQDLIFFDEIQDCPAAISSLRYFREKSKEKKKIFLVLLRAVSWILPWKKYQFLLVA
jgi:uncharacterized protein